MSRLTGAINEDEEHELIREQQRESCNEDEEFWLSGGELDCMVRPWRGAKRVKRLLERLLIHAVHRMEIRPGVVEGPVV